MLMRETLEELYSRQRLSQRAVARLLKVGHTTVRRYLERYGIPTLERDVFVWNEDAAYLLGALLGDGCAYISHNGRLTTKMYRVDLQVSDEAFARRVFDTGKRIPHLRPHWYKPQVVKNSIKISTRYKVGFLSKKLYQLLSDLKNEPFGLLNLIENTKQAIFLLSGFFDAEGCHCEKDHRHYLKMTNTNYDLLSISQLILQKIGFDFRLVRTRKADTKQKTLYDLISTKRSEINSFLCEVSHGRKG